MPCITYTVDVKRLHTAVKIEGLCDVKKKMKSMKIISALFTINVVQQLNKIQAKQIEIFDCAQNEPFTSKLMFKSNYHQ